MRRAILVINLFFFTACLGFAQEYKIKGKIVYGQSLKPVGEISVGFDSAHVTQTASDGMFEILANNNLIKDTLKIILLNYNKIQITNFPQDSVIDLGNIPIYEYYYGFPLVHFDCGSLDFACKRKRRKFWKEFEKERAAYFNKMNEIIGHYRLSLKGEVYSIDTEKGLIDLNNPVEE